jgi:hypothetical protein
MGRTFSHVQVKKINDFTDTLVNELRQKLRALIDRAGKESTTEGKAAALEVGEHLLVAFAAHFPCQLHGAAASYCLHGVMRITWHDPHDPLSLPAA